MSEYHGPLNFAVATNHRPFAARLNRSSRGRVSAGDSDADSRCIQVGLIGRTYRLSVEEAAGVVKSLREQLDTGNDSGVGVGADRIRVLIPGDKYSHGSSSGNRRAATRGEAASLIRDLEAAISASEVNPTPEV